MEAWLQFLGLSYGLYQQLSIQDRDNDETSEASEQYSFFSRQDLHRRGRPPLRRAISSESH